MKAIGAGAMALAGALAFPARAELDPHSLTDAADRLLPIYNAADAPALHAILAPALRDKYTVDALRDALRRCRVLTHDIFRFSTPSYGGRHYGFFAVYAEASTFEMILEIDEDERLLHFVITDDVTAADQQCALHASPGGPERARARP